MKTKKQTDALIFVLDYINSIKDKRHLSLLSVFFKLINRNIITIKGEENEENKTKRC